MNFVSDIKYAVRNLVRRPAFTAIAVMTLALGIGANTAIFSVVNAVLLRPLPLKDPDHLMTFWHSAPAKGLNHMDLNDALFAYYRERTRTFEGLAAFTDGEFSLTGSGDPEVVTGAVVSYNYPGVLGREPLVKRSITVLGLRSWVLGLGPWVFPKTKAQRPKAQDQRRSLNHVGSS